MLRIIWLSDRICGGNSAYSRITREVCSRLASMGYPMAHIPMSNASRLGKLLMDGVWVYPSGVNMFGEDVAVRDYINFNADILVTLKEPWVFRNLPNTAINYVPIVPLDHSPISTAITANLTLAFKAIAISRFGEREMRQAGVGNVEYIPHGSDSETFRPLDADAKKKCRALWGFPEEDDFTVVLVKMNRARGMIARQLRGYKRFLENNPDVKSHLLLWTNVQPSSPENYEGAVSLGLADVGVNLLPEIFYLKLNKKVMHPSNEDYQEGLVDWKGDDYTHGYDMVKLYNSADCLLYATGGEGFGLPLIEAQLCFPSGTNVFVDGAIGGYVRSYSGELIDIETERGYHCAVTPNHPFATPYGWLPANLLNVDIPLFVGVNYGQKNVDERAIRGLVEELPKSSNKRVIPINKSYATGSSEQDAGSTYEEEIKIRLENEKDMLEQNRPCIHSRNSRWGREHNPSDIQESAIQTTNPNSQRRERPNGLASKEVALSLDFYRNKEELHTPSIRVSYTRNGILSTIPKIRALHRYKEKTHADNFILDTKQNEGIDIRRLLRLRNGTYKGNTLVELETIDKIQSRTTSNIKVYNLATLDGIYFANDFLVHNCGVPVVATNYAAGPELVGAGELVEANDYEIMNTPGVRYALPSIDGIAKALENVYNSNREKQAKRARAYAVKYDHKIVLEKYWKPFLDLCELELKPLVTRDGVSTW